MKPSIAMVRMRSGVVHWARFCFIDGRARYNTLCRGLLQYDPYARALDNEPPRVCTICRAEAARLRRQLCFWFDA
jgi:hypothetical protein